MTKVKWFFPLGRALAIMVMVCPQAFGAQFNLDFNTDPSALGVEFFGTAE